MSHETNFVMEVGGIVTKSADLSTLQDPLRYIKQLNLLDGTDADEATARWHDRRTIASSTSETLDLAGSLTTPLGDTFNAAVVKIMVFYASSTNTGNLSVTPNTTGNAFSDWANSTAGGVKLKPGYGFALFGGSTAGYTVTGGSADTLLATNSTSGTLTYDVIIVASS